MWRDRPWTGVGPDNFRRLYGRYARRAFWDDRVTANNLFLEIAAGTGVLGLLSFAGMLAAAAARALPAAGAPIRGARLEAQALLALLAVFVTHGAVDYLLGATGPYLLFAFVVGGASAAPVRALAVVSREEAERGAA
jgi:O-antigen ligase